MSRLGAVGERGLPTGVTSVYALTVPAARSIALSVPVVPAFPALRTLRAYGEDDDPLRLVVVLAQHLGERLPEQADAVGVCMAPQSTWDARREALGGLIQKAAQRLDGHYAAIIDPDALVPPPVARVWDDHAAERIRRQFRSLLIDAFDAGGWLIARPCPAAALTEQLGDIALDSSPEQTSTDEPLERSLAAFAPDVRPIARSLVASGRLPAERIDDILEETRDPDRHVLTTAYDALPEGARSGLRQISVARAPNDRNGAFGAFRWATHLVGPLDLNPRDVDVLVSASFLRADDAGRPCRFALARRARRYALGVAGVVDGTRVADAHRALGNDVGFDRRTPEEQIEVHHHAARAGDVELARRTARYFGTELRRLATDLSVERGDYAAAARLFRDVVDRFDASDAYAWEYLGFNLARSGGPIDEILTAYDRAWQLDSANPLYHGRLLGFRAQHGQDVQRTIDAALAAYASDPTRVSWFIKPILDGLRRGNRTAERRGFITRWRTLLERAAPDILAMHWSP